MLIFETKSDANKRMPEIMISSNYQMTFFFAPKTYGLNKSIKTYVDSTLLCVCVALPGSETYPKFPNIDLHAIPPLCMKNMRSGGMGNGNIPDFCRCMLCLA